MLYKCSDTNKKGGRDSCEAVTQSSGRGSTRPLGGSQDSTRGLPWRKMVLWEGHVVSGQHAWSSMEEDGPLGGARGLRTARVVFHGGRWTVVSGQHAWSSMEEDGSHLRTMLVAILSSAMWTKGSFVRGRRSCYVHSPNRWDWCGYCFAWSGRVGILPPTRSVVV